MLSGQWISLPLKISEFEIKCFKTKTRKNQFSNVFDLSNSVLVGNFSVHDSSCLRCLVNPELVWLACKTYVLMKLTVYTKLASLYITLTNFSTAIF